MMERLKAEISDFLHNHKVINLSYVDNNGNPQACALWYASSPELEIYYLSALSTQHGMRLQDGANIAFTINRDDQHWKSIQGIQGRGTVDILKDPQEAWTYYTDKFPFVNKQFPELDDALEKTKLWKIMPKWIRFIDNTKGFGHKEEIEF